MLNTTIEINAPADVMLNCIREVIKSYDPTFFYVNQKALSIFFASTSLSLFKYRLKKTIDSKMCNKAVEYGWLISIQSISDNNSRLHILCDCYLGHSDNQGYIIEFLAEFMRRVEERLT